MKIVPRFFNPAEIQAAVQKQYMNKWPNPIEVILRGNDRAKKERNVREAIRSVQEAKKDLANSLSVVQKKIARHHEVDSSSRSENGIPSRSPDETLNQADRVRSYLKIAKEETQWAEHLDHDVDLAIASLNHCRDQYLKSVSNLYFRAYDAYWHNALAQCGWTWWR